MAEFLEMPDAEEEEQETPQPLMPDPEPEDALTVFNREWNQKLEEKRQKEEAAEEESRASAAEDLASWESQRENRLNSKKEINRSEEQVLLEQQESDLDAGNVWDRVTKLIETGVDADELEKADVSRMRKLFIQLKNEPLEASRGAMVEA